jgi:hypothetical protein
VILLLARLAAAADPDPGGALPIPTSDPELDVLEQRIAELRASNELGIAEVELTRRELARAMALLESAAILLDDRRPTEDRIAAADALAATGDPRALPLLRAGARDRNPEIQFASATAALGMEAPAALEIVEVVLLDPYATRDVRSKLVQRLGNHGTEAAGEILFGVSSARDVPARIRSEAVRQLAEHHPEILARNGGAPSVVDPLGGLMFVAANGFAGGVLLSSVGSWGQLDNGDVIGGVGGVAVGLGASTVYAVTRPLTSGEGLAYASSVTWGYTYARWASDAAVGPRSYLRRDERERATTLTSGLSALGMLGGVGMGAYALAREPTPWDVLEIDTAGYLGSAIGLGTVALATWRPPVDDGLVFTRTTPYGYGSTPSGTAGPESGLSEFALYDRAASRRHAVAQLTGATVGLVGGAVLSPRWELEPRDALFALVLGSQGAVLGNVTPALVGADRNRLKGFVRLPWNAGIAGGLVAAEQLDPSIARTGSMAWGSAMGDCLGAGLPMLFGFDDPRSVATFLVPFGALGTAAGVVAHPYVEPTAGDAAMIGVGTAIAASQGLLVSAAIADLGGLADSGQTAGAGLGATGATGIALYGLASVLEPRVDEMMVLGSAAGWGGFYGSLVPAALGADADSAAVLLPTSLVSAAATVGAGLAMRPEDGLAPAATVIPQLAAASGATLGVLSVALGSDEGSDAALGALVGATVGFGIGVGIEASRQEPTKVSARFAPKLPGSWMPLFQPRIAADGSFVPMAGVHAVGW